MRRRRRSSRSTQPLPNGRYRWRTIGPRKRDAEIVRDEINGRIALGALDRERDVERLMRLRRLMNLEHSLSHEFGRSRGIEI